MVHLKEKKLKYKRIARKLRETLGKREQEVTDLIVDNNEMKGQMDRVKREAREEVERGRLGLVRGRGPGIGGGAVCRLPRKVPPPSQAHLGGRGHCGRPLRAGLPRFRETHG